MTQKHTIRLTTATVANPETGGKEFQVRATVKLDGKQLFAQGADDDNAIRALKAKVAEYQRGQEFKAQYPKTVEEAL